MAKRLNPSSVKAILGLWQAYFAEGRYHIARQLSQECTGITPQSQLAWLAHGLSLLALGRHSEARVASMSALEIDRGNPDGYWLLGAAAVSTGDYQDALGHFEKALSLDANHRMSLVAIPILLSCCPKEAIRDGKRALILASRACRLTEGKDAHALMAKACAHAECGDYLSAIQVARESLALVSSGSAFHEGYKEILSCLEQSRPFRFSPGPGLTRSLARPYFDRPGGR